MLFITGYAENAAVRPAFLGTNIALITMLPSLDVLAAKRAAMLSDKRKPLTRTLLLENA